jgi:hypothetical protein
MDRNYCNTHTDLSICLNHVKISLFKKFLSSLIEFSLPFTNLTHKKIAFIN